MIKLSDAELVAATGNGDREAFGQLAERHQPLAHAVAVGIVKDADIARELVQEAIMRAYLSLGDLRHADRFRAWFLVIVRNMSHTYVSNRKNRGLSLEVLDRGGHYAAPEGFPGAPLSPHHETEDRDLYRRVLEAVNTLSDKNRKATLLFYYDRFSHREIADYLGVSVAAVKSCLFLFRARAQLADLLAPLYPEFSVTREPRSKPMIELTVANVVPLSLDGYYAVLLLDKAGRRVLPMTVSKPTSSLIQESLTRTRNRSSQSSEGAKILVVDDEFAMREVLGKFLSNLGYVVLEAHNGLSALERIEQESPDLVLLNIAMPRVGGYRSPSVAQSQAHPFRHSGRSGHIRKRQQYGGS